MSAADDMNLSTEDWQRIAAAKDEALDAIVRERNTWARQMADLRDELDAARDDRDKAWEAKAEAQNERDAMQARIEDRADLASVVAQFWAPGDSPEDAADAIRAHLLGGAS